MDKRAVLINVVVIWPSSSLMFPRVLAFQYVQKTAWNERGASYEEIRDCFVNVVFGHLRVRWSGGSKTPPRASKRLARL